MRLGLALVVALVSVMASGCVGRHEAPRAEPADFSDLPAALLLSGCRGAWALIPLPDAVMPRPPVPPGWEVDQESAAFYSYILLDCDSISLGPFERGPVTILFESHESFTAPPECRKGGYDILNPLIGTYVSDADVTRYLSSTLGIRSQEASFSYTKTGPELLHTVEWTWKPFGGEESRLVTARVENPSAAFDYVYRYAWSDGTNLSTLDLNFRPLETAYEPVAAIGSFGRPMFLANAPSSTLVGQGGNWDGADPVGSFSYFGDLRCEQPLH